MIEKQNITGIILAGGKSSRMKIDKGFLMYKGESFMQHSIDALHPLVSQIIIVSNKKTYDAFKLKRVNDCIDNVGPLAGLYSGLKESSTTYNLVLSCDVPLINSKILKKLLQTNYSNFDVIQFKSNGQTMPLIALYKKTCETVFKNLLQKGERRLRHAVNTCRVKTIVLNSEDENLTRNINSPEQLNKLTHEISN